MKLTEVIRRPITTEKTTVLREDGRTLVFQVAKNANKIDVSGGPSKRCSGPRWRACAPP